MAMPNDPTAQDGAGNGADDIASILQATSDTEPGQGAGDVAQGTPAQTVQGTEGGFKFAGRSFRSQKDAEDAWNKVYGKYSESQGLVNAVKKALQSGDAELLEYMAQDENFAPVLEKLGIEVAKSEAEEEEPDAEGFEGQYAEMPAPMQELYNRMALREAQSVLRDEERDFESKLGRKISDEEHNRTMEVVVRADSLSFEEAFWVANKQRILKETHEKAMKTAGTRQKGNRPPPTAPFLPGVSMDMKKPVTEMTKSEAREHLRQIIREQEAG